MKTILAAIDIKKEEEHVVRKAIEIAKAFGAQLWIIHASAPDPDFVSYQAGPQSVRDERAKTLLKEKHILETLAGLAKKEGVEAKALLIQGPTIDLILEETQKLNADMLIIGHYRTGFFQKLLKGSVARGILENVPVPLLVVPLD